MMTRKRSASLSSTAVVAALACLAAHAAPRAYVASDGNDARGGGRCTLTSPCRTFQAAHDTVDAGGEIVALDTADFAPVTIAKSVSVIGSPGFVAGIVVMKGNGVTIATGGVDVILRNLSISGAGGANGVEMTAGRSLTLDNCVVSGLAANGVFVSGAASVDVVNSRFVANGASGLQVETQQFLDVTATVSDSVASRNGRHGFGVTAGSWGRASMSLTRATASNNADSGFRVEALITTSRATMIVGSSMATHNLRGFNNTPGSLTGIPHLESLGNNIVRGNGTDIMGFAALQFSGY